MKANKVYGLIVAAAVVLIGFTTLGIKFYNTEENLNDTIGTLELAQDELSNIRNELQKTQDELSKTKNDLSKTKENLDKEIKISTQLNGEVSKLTQALKSAEGQIAYLEKHSDAHNGWAMCWRDVQLNQDEIDFFAKLLYCEAGIMGHEGQFWVASAILNLSEHKGMSIWEMGHKESIFAVAPWVDDAKPTQQQYDIIYEVLNNGWIADVCFFRTQYPHTFGNFMVQIENIYFSSP